MQISYEWLSSLVDLSSWTPQRVAQALIQAGIEVEDVTPFARATRVTTGKVLSKKSVEGSSHLSHVIVDTGHHGTRSIVCGAPNIDVGQIVLVALPGAELAIGTIQASTIRGVASEGMVCALSEFGIPNKFLTKDQLDGIEVLSPSTPLGHDDILHELGLTDTILHVKLLANRPDLLSLENFALEVSAVCQVPLIPVNAPNVNQLRQPSSMSINVESPHVQQFSLQVLRGVTSITTPNWMKARLMSSGVRPLSFFVDIGNYIMLLTGQPLHMYDVNKLPVSSLSLLATSPSSFTALDEKTYTLLPTDVTITSDNHVMCVAGVMGALACAVDETTTDIAIEAASFNPASIRKTALRLNLMSESSQRFAKGVSHHDYERVLHMTESLIASLTSITSFEQRLTYDVMKQPVRTIPFQPSRMNALLGTSFSEDVMISSLARLGIRIEHGIAYIPPHRVDMAYAADLAEEIIRLNGFDTIQPTPFVSQIRAGGLTRDQEKRQRIKNHLRHLGLYESLTYSLVNAVDQASLNLLSTRSYYTIKNPLSDERQDVRSHGLASLLDVALYNASRQTYDAAFFEWSGMASPQGDHEELNVVLMGNHVTRSGLHERPHSFYHGKGIVESILTLLHIDSTRTQWVREEHRPDILHPGRSAALLLQGEKVGVIGELSPIIREKKGFGKTPVVVIQLDMTSLLAVKTSALRLTPLAKYPSVSRDLAFVVKTRITFADIVKTIRKAGKSNVQSVDVFDLYQGEHVPTGFQSMAIRIKLLDPTKTLLDTEIQALIDAIKTQLVTDHHVEFRT
jgi:phenylalanyl-tRNA synthetase beta chain